MVDCTDVVAEIEELCLIRAVSLSALKELSVGDYVSPIQLLECFLFGFLIYILFLVFVLKKDGSVLSFFLCMVSVFRMCLLNLEMSFVSCVCVIGLTCIERVFSYIVLVIKPPHPLKSIY